MTQLDLAAVRAVGDYTVGSARGSRSTRSPGGLSEHDQ